MKAWCPFPSSSEHPPPDSISFFVFDWISATLKDGGGFLNLSCEYVDSPILCLTPRAQDGDSAY